MAAEFQPPGPGRWQLDRSHFTGTTTVVDLFGDTSTTTTIGKLVVPGWMPTNLPNLVVAADECVDLAEIGADPLPEEGPRTVTVESGDSLGKIAKRYDLSLIHI